MIPLNLSHDANGSQTRVPNGCLRLGEHLLEGCLRYIHTNTYVCSYLYIVEPQPYVVSKLPTATFST